MSGRYPSVASIARLVTAAATDQDIPRVCLVGPQRSAPVARVRFAVAWAATQGLGASSKQVADALGRGCHSTIVHACQRARDLRDRDTDFRDLTDRLLKVAIDG